MDNRSDSQEESACAPRRWQMLKTRLNNLSPEDFARALERAKDLQLLDVRTPEEYEQGHLPGALNISYLTPDLWDRLEKLDPRKEYFVYCRTERRALRVCTLMQNGGFAKVHNLDGGLCSWEEAFGTVAYER